MRTCANVIVAGTLLFCTALGGLTCNGNRNGGSEAIITDRTGRTWNVTHALHWYGMDPDHFNFGLGVGAIPSVDTPRVIKPGEPGYPEQRDLEVFGLWYEGGRYAYPIADLTRHEVFNVKLGGDTANYAAVAY